MDLSLLPDLERKEKLAQENSAPPQYSVIEYKGYYARVSIYAGLGELFTLLPSKNAVDSESVSGVVVRSSKQQGVSLVLLDSPLNSARQPFIATRLYTEFFKVDSIYDNSESTT